MSNGIIAFIASIAASAWLYAKLMRSTGNNTRSSIIGAAIAGVFLFIILFFVLGIFIK